MHITHLPLSTKALTWFKHNIADSVEKQIRARTLRVIKAIDEKFHILPSYGCTFNKGIRLFYSKSQKKLFTTLINSVTIDIYDDSDGDKVVCMWGERSSNYIQIHRKDSNAIFDLSSIMHSLKTEPIFKK